MIGNKKKQEGFTLLETIVALGIFAVVVTMVSGLFFSAERQHRHVRETERVASAGRELMEGIVDTIRSKSIDYAGGAACLVRGSRCLALADAQGNVTRFTQSGTILMASINAGPSLDLSPPGVRVVDTRFFVQPIQDPFRVDRAGGSYWGSAQPMVTVVLKLESDTTRMEDRSSLLLQTTISSRIYKR